jgi:hypothetical protein
MKHVQETSQFAGELNTTDTESEQTSQIEQLMEIHGKIVYAALWSVLQGQQDLAEDTLEAEVRALYFDTWIWAWENLDSLLTPGTASISTRLYAKAYWIARSWKTTRLRHRQRFVSYDEHLSVLDAEQHITSRALNRACQSLISDASQSTAPEAETNSSNSFTNAA